MGLSAQYRMAHNHFNRALQLPSHTPATILDYCYYVVRIYRTEDALAAEYLKYFFHESEKDEVCIKSLSITWAFFPFCAAHLTMSMAIYLITM